MSSIVYSYIAQMPRATSINPMLSQAILNRRLQSKVEQRRRDPELSLLRTGILAHRTLWKRGAQPASIITQTTYKNKILISRSWLTISDHRLHECRSRIQINTRYSRGNAFKCHRQLMSRWPVPSERLVTPRHVAST